jgi:hypothetical protein
MATLTENSKESLAKRIKFLAETHGLHFGEDYTGDIHSPSKGSFYLDKDKGTLRLDLNTNYMAPEYIAAKVGALTELLMQHGAVNADSNLCGNTTIDMTSQLQSLDTLPAEKVAGAVEAYTQLHGMPSAVIEGRGDLLKNGGKVSKGSANYSRNGNTLTVEITLAATGDALEEKIASAALASYSDLGKDLGFRQPSRLGALVGGATARVA